MVMFGNGASNKGETDKGKKVYGYLGFKPIKGLQIDVYGNYEHQKDNIVYYIYQGFVGFKDSWGRVGLQFARRFFKQNEKRDNWNIISVFGVLKMTEAVELTVRYDKTFEANPNGEEIPCIPFSSIAPSNFILAGISWEAAKKVWFIPNIKHVFYDDPQTGKIPSEDIYLNMTVYFKF